MKKGFLLFIAAFTCMGAMAQQGFLRGKILDGETGEGLIGATVVTEGTTAGAVTDFDGNYSISLDPGTHNIVIRFVSYQSKTVNDVEIKAGEVTLLDVTLSGVTAELAEIVITAEQITDNEVALLSLQKKSPNVVNGISSQAFRKIGDGDLNSAMKRVTGVSVQGGKYVFVRGLGDRYTKTTLNQMAIPGLDPDRNTVQIDLFPTSTIENVVVYKTFTPNLPADFAGGLVDIETKKYPDEKITTVQVGFEYNPDMHFKDNYVTYPGSSTDFLGFDNGTRALPFNKNLDIPDISAPDGFLVEDITRSFEPTMGAETKSSFMNYGFNINHGNQINRPKVTWGYNAVLNYKNEEEFYPNAQFGEYGKNPDADIDQLTTFQIRKGPVGGHGVLWSALLSGAMKYDKHDFALTLLHNQNGVSQTTDRTNVDFEDNPAVLLNDILAYAQRQISTGILSGRHNFNKFDLEWAGSFSNSNIDEPDYRVTKIQEIPIYDSEGNQTGYRYSLNTGVGGGINRFWRELNEMNESFKIDLTYPYGEKNKLKIGALALFKQRDFEVLDYAFRVRDRGNIVLTDNPNDYFDPINIWTPQKNEGTFTVSRISTINNEVNSFYATSETNGYYAMSEQYIGSKFRVVYGLRLETAKMYYTGTNQQGQKLNDAETLNELNFLPSINLTYEVTEKMNFRASYNKTLARPSFREKSNAQIYDPISDRTVIGNLDLQQTNIDNYDLGWGYFFGTNEVISISPFYKHFEGTIEQVAFQTAPDQLTYQNSGSSEVYGVELEFRKNIIPNLAFGANATLIKSQIDMNDIIVNEDNEGNVVTEKENRELWAREGEEISNYRDMAGQAPYLINAYLNWNNKTNTVNANLSYNVQGETLSIVGSGVWPDIYTLPFNSLNFNIYKDFGIRKNSRIYFKISNILGSKKQDVYKSYGTANQIFSVYEPGRAFAMVYRYTF